MRARRGSGTFRGSRLRRWASFLGGRVEQRGRRLFGRVLDLVLPVADNVALDDVRDVRRILLVRPNFRLGNALISSPLVHVLLQRFPGARIDYLGGEGTLSVLDNLPLGEREAISRRFVLRPWRFAGLFLRLRRRRYDLAVEGALGSFSGGLYTWLSGARYRAGVVGKGDRFLNVRLAPVPVGHAYDAPVAFGRLLGVGCAARPSYVVSQQEARTGRAVLCERGVADEASVAPFVALFVGGHAGKRWPQRHWTEVARRLAAKGALVLVFAGPDEAPAVGALAAALAGAADVVPPQPLRVFAAALGGATLIVTPDSGPMHLAAALEVPTIAVLNSERSSFFAPRGPLDAMLLRPTPDQVVAAVMAHPSWRDLGAERLAQPA